MTSGITPASVRSEELRHKVLTRQLSPIQVQLAACLGYEAAKKARLPQLELTGRHNAIHSDYPQKVQRVLNAAKSGRRFGLPPRLSVLWGALCAERALGKFEEAVSGDNRPRRAIETAKAWVEGKATIEEAKAAAQAANDAIDSAMEFGKNHPERCKGANPEGKPWCEAEAAVYAARQAAQAVLTRDQQNLPEWAVRDLSAVNVGHAAWCASQAAININSEYQWQRNKLIELILNWDTEEWLAPCGRGGGDRKDKRDERDGRDTRNEREGKEGVEGEDEKGDKGDGYLGKGSSQDAGVRKLIINEGVRDLKGDGATGVETKKGAGEDSESMIFKMDVPNVRETFTWRGYLKALPWFAILGALLALPLWAVFDHHRFWIHYPLWIVGGILLGYLIIFLSTTHLFSRSLVTEIRATSKGFTIVHVGWHESFDWNELEAARFMGHNQSHYVMNRCEEPEFFFFRARGKTHEVLLDGEIHSIHQTRWAIHDCMEKHLRRFHVPMEHREFPNFRKLLSQMGAWVFVASAFGMIAAHHLGWHTFGTVIGAAVMFSGVCLSIWTWRERISRLTIAAVLILILSCYGYLKISHQTQRDVLLRWEQTERPSVLSSQTNHRK